MTQDMPDAASIIKPKEKTNPRQKPQEEFTPEFKGTFCILAIILILLCLPSWTRDVTKALNSSMFTLRDRTYKGDGGMVLRCDGTCQIECPYSYYHGVSIPGAVVGKWHETSGSVIIDLQWQGCQQEVSYSKTKDGSILAGGAEPFPTLLQASN